MTLWYRISAIVPREQQESVMGVLLRLAPAGLEVDEAVEIHGPDAGFTVRRDEPVTISAYFPGGELGAVLVEELRGRLGALPGVELRAKPVQEEDWSTSWREFFGVVDPGGRVVVAPSWATDDLPPGKLVVRIDPGQAFGTGHHQTTQLCLLALEEHVRPGCTFLDVGTGSGVLAIGALLLGARSGVALDIDPAAVEAATANIRLAGLADRVDVRRGSLDGGHEGRYDVVVANLFTGPIIELGPALARALRPDGVLIVSGLLGEDVARVSDALGDAGLQVSAVRHRGEWAAIDLRPRDRHSPA